MVRGSISLGTKKNVVFVLYKLVFLKIISTIQLQLAHILISFTYLKETELLPR